MKKIIHYKKAEIWMINLNPTLGIEMQKIRPCLILRVYSRTHIVILPISSKIKPEKFSFYLKNISFLSIKKSWICISQIKTIDTQRCIRKLGQLSEKKFIEIQKKSEKVLELSPRKANAYNESEEKNSTSEG